MSPLVEINVLGSWQVYVGRQPVEIPPGHQRVLLSSLALSAGQPVSAAALGGQLWDQHQPGNVRGTLATYVTRLRGVLGKPVILASPGGGYRLSIDQDHVDLHRFRKVLRRARETSCLDTERVLLREALELWRGSPFGGVTSTWLERDVVPALTEEWFTATERRIDLDLAHGTSGQLVAELSRLTTEYPLRESLWLRLIGALRRSGRRADALAAYHQVRTVLGNELGVDPGIELQQLHQEILREFPDGQTARPRASAVHSPHQLPHDNAKFVGQRDDLAALDKLVATINSTPDTAGPTIIVAIDGAPGTGKTTLAVHWAHRMAHRYPDVQLYVNLRGYSADDPVHPAAAIETVLRALGIPIERVPPGLDERSALLRSTLAGRRSLVLLDNARDAADVRALLPGAGALVIVTSRNQLRALSIRDGAHRLSLRRLSRADAVELLGVAIGSERVAAEAEAAERLAELCDGLPLALTIVAERAQRADTLSQVVEALTHEMSAPDTFSAGMGSELYATLSWSYRNLEPAAAALFRKLGLHPANDIGVAAAAAIADLPVAQAKQILDQLVDAHMVEQRQSNRYELHDLIRLYAAQEARRGESAQSIRTTIQRILDWYLHAALSADSVLQPHRVREFVAPFEPSSPPPGFADQELAIAWFEREFDSLRSIVRWAAASGWCGHAWRIVIAMTTFLDRRIAWREGMEVLQTAVAATRADNDRLGEGYALNSFACLQMDKGDLALARDYLEQALDCFVDTSHRPGEILVLGNLGLVLAQLGEPEPALRLCSDAMDLATRFGYQRVVANNLNNMGIAHVAMGDHDRAIDCFLEADLLFDEIGDVELSSSNLYDLGRAFAATHRYAESIGALRRAAAGYRRLSNRRWWAVVLLQLGKVISDTGHPRWARACWEAALEVMRDLADPRAQELEKLIG